MNLAPSMMLPKRSTRGQSSRSLRRRIVSVGAVAALVVLGALGYSGLVILKKMVAGDEDAHIVNAATLSKQLVDRLITERTRQVELIASEPSVIAAAKKGAQVARDRKLPTMSNDQLETTFKFTRSQQVDVATKQYLTALLPKLDIAEVMLTDEYGYNAVTTSPSSDFVQSDEAWWLTAWNSGLTTAQATADPATQRTVVELAGVVRDGSTRVGVVKVKFGLSMVDSVLAQGSIGGNELRVDLVDSAGKVIASSGLAARFKRLPGFTALQSRD